MISLKGLPLPISKNQLHQPVPCGRFFKMVRTKASKLRGEMIIAHIWKQLGGRIHDPIFTKPCMMTWTVTFPDNRKRDRHNYMEHLADCLQAAGVVADDSLIKFEVGEEMPGRERPGHVDLTIEEIP